MRGAIINQSTQWLVELLTLTFSKKIKLNSESTFLLFKW